MEPTVAINLLETVLRDLVRLAMGESWTSTPGIDTVELASRRDEESRKRRGSVVSNDLLDYTEFYHLQSIITKNWAHFEPALGKKKYIDVYLDRLGGLRNSAMHSRALLPFERHLVEGIVGEFRNLIVIYRSQQGNDMEFYPSIEVVTDSFGRSSEPQKGLVQPKLRVAVDDLVTFECHGADPEGKALTWHLRPSNAVEEGARTTEGAITLGWQVQQHHVREHFVVWIRLIGNRPFHRHGDFDDEVGFLFEVVPPL